MYWDKYSPLYPCCSVELSDILTFTQAQASASCNKPQHKACTKTNIQLYPWCSVEIDDIKTLTQAQATASCNKPQHKACIRTNIHHYIPAVLLQLMTSRHLPKHSNKPQAQSMY